MKLILACDPNGGIGYENKLPWTSLRGDLSRFKNLTMHQVVVMGRNTWDSLPIKPLSNRLNIVVTSTPLNSDGAIRVPDLSAFAKFNDAWLIGGGKLINSNWDIITEVHLTRAHSKYTCDTFVDMTPLQEHFSCYSLIRNDDHDYEIWRKDTY